MIQNQLYSIACKLIAGQLIGVVAVACFMALVKNPICGFAALVGGLPYVLLNGLFALWVFRYNRAQDVYKFITAFMFGEAFKLVLGASLFLVVVQYLPFSLLCSLIGFIGAIISFWMASLWCFTRRK